MNTEKRLALCFALSMLIIILFSWYSQKMNPPAPKPRQTQTDRTTPTPTQPNEFKKEEAVQEEPEKKPTKVEGPWSWLTKEDLHDSTENVLVESELYRVEFTKNGAIPVSWELLKFKELFKDPRYLKLAKKTGDRSQRQKAQLELSFYQKSQETGPQPVDAIDPTFAPGKAGFIMKWGKTMTGREVAYQCNVDRLYVNQPKDVVFEYRQGDLSIEKIFRFYPDNYHVDLQIRITNHSDEKISFDEENFYDLAWFGGFGFPSMRDDAVNNAYLEMGGDTNIQPKTALLNELKKKQADLLPDYKSFVVAEKGTTVNWAGVDQKYFLAAIVPEMLTEFALKGVSSPGGEANYVMKPMAGVRMTVDPILAGAKHVDRFKLYVGPKEDDALNEAEPALTNSRQIFLKSFTGPISKLMLKLLQGFYSIVPNYGVAIILITLLVKLLMLPLYTKQMHSMKKMQALQPQINALKEKYKDEPQKMQKEQMELFRKHKVNPLSGCLTMLPTIPIFIALYATFGMALELRGAPFFGWIHDLSAPDGAFYIPLGSFIFTVNILPIAYAGLMLISTSQQKVEGPNATMMKVFPLIFVFFFWKIASGVILYFVISIFIDFIQRIMMDKFKTEPSLPEGKKK